MPAEAARHAPPPRCSGCRPVTSPGEGAAPPAGGGAPPPRLVAPRAEPTAPSLHRGRHPVTTPGNKDVAPLPSHCAAPVPSPAAACHPAAAPQLRAAEFRRPLSDNPASLPMLARRRRGWGGRCAWRSGCPPRAFRPRSRFGRAPATRCLDDAAMTAVWHWRFVPARRGSEAVEGVVVVPIRFRLGDDEPA